MKPRTQIRRTVTVVTVVAVLCALAGLAVARPWQGSPHRPAPLGIGSDPDAPAGHPIDADKYLAARSAFARARFGDPLADGHRDLRAVAVRQLHRAQAQQADAGSAAGPGQPGAAGAPQSATAAAADEAWTAIGPNGLPNGQTIGNEVPVSGRATSIAVDPTNADIVYIGTANGGVFRTTNGGTDWVPILDQAQSLAIGALALAPSDPTTLYVGTGEASGSGDSYAGVGLYRIANARTTAEAVGPINPTVTFGGARVPAFRGSSISRILVSATDPGTVVVTSGYGWVGNGHAADPQRWAEGIFRSTNADAAAGDVSFTPMMVPGQGPEQGADVAALAPDLGILLVSVTDQSGDGSGGIWRVTGAFGTPTWTNELPLATGDQAHLAVNGAVAYAYSAGSTHGDLRTSTDGGLTWTTSSAPMAKEVCGGQCRYDSPVAVDPADAQHLLLGGSADSYPSHILVESSDGGITSDNGTHTTHLHADNHAIAFAPHSPSGQTVVWDATDGGVFKSVDGGLSWTSENTPGLNTLQFESLAVAPYDPDITIGGTQDNGTEEHTGPDPSAWSRVDWGDGGFALVDSHSTAASQTFYHTYFNATGSVIGLARWRSTDGYRLGEGNWSLLGCGGSSNGISCSDNTLFYAPMALGPGSPNDTVYFGTDRLYRSTDQGSSMSVVGSSGAIDGAHVSAIAIAPTDDSERLVGLDDGSVWLSTGTGPLTKLAGPWPTTQGDPAEGTYISSLAIDPTDPQRAYVVLGDFLQGADLHVWSTSDLLSADPTWTAGTGLPDIPVNSVVIDPRTPADVFVGTQIGVYASADHGATWQPFGTGLPVVPVVQMAVASPGTAGEALRVATHGRGIWQLPLPVLKHLDSVTVTPSSATIAKGQVEQYDAVANFSDGSTTDVTGSATWSTSDTSVATIGATTGLAHGVGVGSGITVTATYQSKSGTAGLTVDPHQLTTITVTPPTSTIVAGRHVALRATGGYTDGQTADVTDSVTWKSAEPSVATVSTSGTVTGAAEGGPVTITAASGSAHGSAQVTVSPATLTSLTVASTHAIRLVGQKQPFVATGHYSDGSTKVLTATVQWSTSAPRVATVVPSGTGAGVTTARYPGRTTIRAVLGSLSGSARLVVRAPRPKVSSFSPRHGKAGTKLTVKGSYFYPGTALVVRIGKMRATHVKALSSQRLTCKVPAHAKSAHVFVTTQGGTGKSRTKFKVR
ncbi:Ig-like domain-containing protein [Nocardioides terrisoli]|uniref:Ig-like domain-containing protein n=1 Tax=Nocardioides terrisoli TaxID=3388267 RepID=UPI00287BB969|nr:Ig-like domain-containing protein [Nocardioides marmorisolisilvae]